MGITNLLFGPAVGKSKIAAELTQSDADELAGFLTAAARACGTPVRFECAIEDTSLTAVSSAAAVLDEIERGTVHGSYEIDESLRGQNGPSGQPGRWGFAGFFVRDVRIRAFRANGERFRGTSSLIRNFVRSGRPIDTPGAEIHHALNLALLVVFEHERDLDAARAHRNIPKIVAGVRKVADAAHEARELAATFDDQRAGTAPANEVKRPEAREAATASRRL